MSSKILVKTLVARRGRVTALALAVLALAGGAFSLTNDTAPAPAARASTVPAESTKTAPGAATACPPFSFVNNVNLAKNASFETVGPGGQSTVWRPGDPIPPPSAARDWLMHTNGPPGDRVASQLRQTTVPGPGGSRMLRFIAGGHEGGIVQQLGPSPPKLMFSAWVFVRRGRVAMAAHADSTLQGPVAWSTKRNEWEQLRVCTDGTVPTGFFSVYNQDTAGGEFFVDRVEIRQTP